MASIIRRPHWLAIGLFSFLGLGFAPCAWADAPAAGSENPISAEYRDYKWSAGDKPVKMLAKEEGFCFLTEVGGHFAGGGESVRVYLGDDGFWYLGGTSGQADLWGKAMSVKFAHKMKAAFVLPEDPNAAAWVNELKKLAAGDDHALKDLAANEQVVVEQAAVADEPQKAIDRAIAWDEPTRKLPLDERRLVEAHILRMFDGASNNLGGEDRKAAVAKTNPIRLAIVNRQLNDLSAYVVRHGDWSQKDGVIVGKGDSRLEFRQQLPADCAVEWKMCVLDGMRPRVLFGGTDAFVANEEFEHKIDIHGVENQRSISVPYEIGDTMKVAVKFERKSVEFYVNDELMGRCTRRIVPEAIALTLRGGDDWSGGTTQFWDIKVSPLK